MHRTVVRVRVPVTGIVTVVYALLMRGVPVFAGLGGGVPHSGPRVVVRRLSTSRFFGMAPGLGSCTGPRRHVVYLVEVVVADQDWLVRVIVVTGCCCCLAARVATCRRLSCSCLSARVVVGSMGFVRMAGMLITWAVLLVSVV